MTQNRVVAAWLFAVSLLVAVMVVFGGWVRLTRSGLSMVEWHIATGVVPPLGQEAWLEAFEQYRQTPEYQKVNAGMSLAEYRAIYYREWGHRVLGRLTGLVLVVPLLGFLVRGTLPWRRSGPYLGLALLFAAQGLLGWYMVKSGLVDQPQVSQYRLTAHLLVALAILGACLWLGFDHAQAAPPAAGRLSGASRKLALALLAAVCLQIAAGGLVAGLKAGYISDTFPGMFGQWVPDGMGRLSPWILNALENPFTVHFQHRWFALVPLGLALVLTIRLRREVPGTPAHRAARAGLALLLAQVLLGIAVVVFHVPLLLALAHQAVGLLIFAVGLFVWYRCARTV